MCTFHLLTPSSPILLSGCDNIVFAPYNSSYFNIEEDSYASGLADALNLWNKPIVVTQNQSLVNGSHWSLMDPKEFTLITVPVELSNTKSGVNATDLINRANVIILFFLKIIIIF
jgi:TBCC domain-containing protein 1